MARRTVVMIVSGTKGHIQRHRPIAAELVVRGVDTVVLTDRRFRANIESVGARFVDLYTAHTIDEADSESRPIPCRYVSFASRFGADVAAHVSTFEPSLIVADAYAVVGRVAAFLLGLPWVNVCSGHDADPATFVESIEPERRAVSSVCHAAVGHLRDSVGIADASPFMFGTGVSPLLNVYCEPEAFLSDATRRSLEPVACFGSLLPPEGGTPPAPPVPLTDGGASDLRVFVAFGTVIWRYYQPEALASLREIASAIVEDGAARAEISLGGADVAALDLAALRGPRVSVRSYVDQWDALRSADVFITHHGLNSTHEAIFHRVPMISRPFFGDQPAMAERCQEMGIAVPLVASARDAVDRASVTEAIRRYRADREALGRAVSDVRDLELDVMARRPAVIDRILDLA